jgi:hypothetical protein
MIRFSPVVLVAGLVACGSSNLNLTVRHTNPQTMVEGVAGVKLKRGESLSFPVSFDVTDDVVNRAGASIVNGIKITPRCSADQTDDAPTGVTCSFEPATLVSPNRETIVTITTTASATPGTYLLTADLDVKAANVRASEVTFTFVE